MSRSRRKTPITGNTTARSEKQDKRLANRKERRTCRNLLRHDPTRETYPLQRELSNVWGFSKDGKHYVRDVGDDPDLMRK